MKQITDIKQKFDLTGKTAIITGASRGIGESIARTLGEFGARVVITARKQESADDAAQKLSALGIHVLAVGCHAGDEEQLQSLVTKTMSHFGSIDILVNNAATNPVFGPLETMTGELFDKLMQINVKAPYILSNLCLPHLKKSTSASVIHISSVEGTKPSQGLGLYSISKAALIMLCKSQAKEWGNYGIRCNVICPGLVQTKFSAALWSNEDLLNHWTKNIPLHRMAHPDEIAGLALFLASDASSYCTGQEFTADGGYLIS
jgi:NAD(P)-dependent dehydrogenase (short-subunit alcohol dehydrogenase family)